MDNGQGPENAQRLDFVNAAVEAGALMARAEANNHGADRRLDARDEEEIFRPQRSLARSPKRGDGVDGVSSTAIQIPAREAVDRAAERQLNREPAVLLERGSVEKYLQKQSEARSRTDSDTGVETGSEKRRFWADIGSKRLCLEGTDYSSAESEAGEATVPPQPSTKNSPPKQDRGRSPNTGEHVGLAATQRALNEAKREVIQLKAELAIANSTALARHFRQTHLSGSSSASEDAAKSVADLNKSVADQVAIIKDVALKSSHLKGTFVRALKEAASAIMVAVESLSVRTTSEETRQLQATNTRLQTEMASLRTELAQIKGEMEQLRSRKSESLAPEDLSQQLNRTEAERPEKSGGRKPAKRMLGYRDPLKSDTVSRDEEFMRAVSEKVGAIITARLEGLEADGRLLPAKPMRPPLAAQKKLKAKQPNSPQPNPVPANLAKSSSKKRRAAQSDKTTDSPQTNEQRESIPALTSVTEPWNKVVSRNSKRRAAKAAAAKSAPQPQQQPKRVKDARKLRSPRSAAVVLTLQPGAEERGVTFKKVIAEAKTKVQLKDIDIPGLRFKRAATGACIMEIQGDTSGDKADKLAAAIKEQLNEEDVRVTRPVKTAEIRITGLDDSVSAAEVVAAVAASGSCSPDLVKAGEVRQGFAGLGTAWVRCPIPAAKKIAECGRLLVGWVSAHVKLLEKRPLQCFRCREIGHVRAQCQSEEDWSELCFRCSKPGHKASQCSDAPQCARCVAVGKPAGHRMGSKACAAPKVSKNKNARKSTTAADGSQAPSQPVQPPANEVDATEEVGQMAVD